MGSKYKGRKREAIREFVAELIMRKVKDPRVSNVSIQRVEAPDDFSVAKIYYNIIGEKDEMEEVRAGLTSCKGYIRSELRNHIRMKLIPELIFIYDKSLDKARRIEKVLKEIHSDEENSGRESDIE
jgi:ribosome-binding factor A